MISVINDPQAHQQQAQAQAPPYLKRAPITESLPSLISNPNEEQIALDIVEQSPSCYRAIPSMTNDISLPTPTSPSLPSPVSPIAEEDRIFTAFRVSSAIDFNDTDNAPVVGHYLTQSSPQDICERGNIIDDFGSIATSISPQLQFRSQSISPSEPFAKNFTLTSDPSDDSLLSLPDEVSRSDGHSNDDAVEDTHREHDCARVVAVPVFITDDLSPDASNSKNMAATIDAASQTDLNIASAANFQLPQPSSTSRNIIPSVFENEIEKLRIEVLDGMTPNNRLYKILGKYNTKLSPMEK